MKDKFEIVNSIKKTILYLDKIIINFPNSEKVLRDKISESMYDILENVYMANESIDRRKFQTIVIVKIRMIDFYFKVAMDKGYISYKKYEKIGEYLTNIIIKIRSWIKSEKKGSLV